MRVVAKVCTVDQLFQPKLNISENIKGKLVIPEYQRPYCWQPKQIKKLLDDIKQHASETPDIPYYLGSIIVHRKEDNSLNIIDGQQRITTLSILQHFTNQPTSNLTFVSPISHNNIKKNLQWLRETYPNNQALKIDAKALELTLVVTQSEDDAYRFFETQNTGGIRLGGPDIIKAHHLREIAKDKQSFYAKKWEQLGQLDRIVIALLRGRYWQTLAMKKLPSHRQPTLIRECIVDELAEKTNKGSDIRFNRIKTMTDIQGCVSQEYVNGYEVHQPLNAGINSIEWLAYFKQLHHKYWSHPDFPPVSGYDEFINWLKKLQGCGYLQNLFETCLLIYISRFGEYQLAIAAKKIFRVVYSRRVSNQKAVRENSIFAFVKETPVLDWIALSYTPEQCFDYLDSFELKLEGSNLDNKDNKNSVKRRFVISAIDQFGLTTSEDNPKTDFANDLTVHITGLGRKQ